MLKLLRRLRYLFRRSSQDAQLQEEIEFHRSMRQRDMEGAGVPQGESRYSSLRVMGSVTLAREDARAVWIGPWLEQTVSDMKYAIRSMLQNPTFSIIVVLTMALGI